MLDGKIVKILGENVRVATCKACDERLGSGKMLKVRFPENTYCICKQCVAEGKPFKPFNVKASKKSSANCLQHRVVVSVADDNADRLWIESYGFKKMGGYHTATFNNAQSIGSLASNLFTVADVKVGLENQPLRNIKSVDDYDRFTKEVCMRNYEQ